MTVSMSSHEIKIATIVVAERLDAVRAFELRQQIETAVGEGIVRLVIDLSSAPFVDSAGLAALAKGMKDCRQENGDLRVVRPQHADAVRVFALTRFDQVFTMADTAQELVSSW